MTRFGSCTLHTIACRRAKNSRFHQSKPISFFITLIITINFSFGQPKYQLIAKFIPITFSLFVTKLRSLFLT